MGAAQAGDPDALKKLSELRTKSAPSTSAPAPSTSAPSAAPSTSAAAPSTTAPSQPLPIIIPVNTTPAMTDAEAFAQVLAACELDILALNKVDGLEEVIAQAKSGEVQRIRDTYGPQKGRPTIPKWASIKVTINRRERVFGVLKDDFNNDEARFFAFFQLVPTNKKPNPHRSIRQIAGATPHMRDQVDEERKNVQYQDLQSGIFSDALWEQRWPGQNGWEVWRSMGKESYDGL